MPGIGGSDVWTFVAAPVVISLFLIIAMSYDLFFEIVAVAFVVGFALSALVQSIGVDIRAIGDYINVYAFLGDVLALWLIPAIVGLVEDDSVFVFLGVGEVRLDLG